MIAIANFFLLMISTKWRPLGRRKRGRPKLTWAEGIKGLMGEKGLVDEDWNDRSNWRKEIM
jgi:hypothetical protein